MISEINRILYVGSLAPEALPEALTTLSSAESYQIEMVDDPGKAMELFGHGKFNLTILNDDLFGKDIFGFIREIKRRSQLTPVIILSTNTNTTYQTNLMVAGADDFVPTQTPKDELYYRLGFRLKQHRQSRDLALRNRKMYNVTMLARRLHSNVEPETLIADTIDQTSSAFKLYGIAIIMMEDDMMCVYAGQEGVVKNANLYETKMYPQTHEPFYRVIENGVAEVYEDITQDPHYVPIPILPEVSSAVIVPLRYQDYNIGVLVAFGRPDNPLSLDDLAIYEILTAQFSVALQNAHYNHNQMMNVQFSRTLRRAWQRFVTLQSPGDISQDLHDMIKDLPGVQQGVVWLHDPDYWWMGKPVISTGNPELSRILDQLIQDQLIFELIEQMDDGPQVLSQLGLGQKDPFFPLFKALRSQQIVVLPIADSTRLIGGVIVSITNNRQFSIDVVNLVKSLTHAAGQALERMTLIFATLEKSGRLEAILLSISEGIFFVDDKGKIAFCNPQFTELTNISPSEMLGQSPDVLLARIASQSRNTQQIHKQLQEAVASLQNREGTDWTYPIVDVEFVSGTNIHVEFTTIENMNTRSDKGWIGIVRDSSRLQGRTSLPAPVYAEGRSRNDGQAVDPVDFVEQIIKRLPPKIKERVRVNAPSGLPPVEVDEAAIEQTLVKSLQNAFKSASREQKVTVNLEQQDNEIKLIVEGSDKTSLEGVQQPASMRISAGVPYLDDKESAAQPAAVLPINGGYAPIAEAAPNNVKPLSAVVEYDEEIDDEDYFEESGIGALGGAPSRAPQTVMLIEGRATLMSSLKARLQTQNYDLLTYRSGEDAIRDVKLTRLDLIVIDMNPTDMTGLEVCEYMRKHTETPIIMISDKVSDSEKVRALNLGADDYITQPISDEELLARVQVIFKRQQLPDRTRKPLKMDKLMIDFARREVFVDTKRIELTRIEYDLLHTLVINMGQVLTHQQILEKVWGPEYRSETQYLWVNICRLRNKLKPANYIQNRQGVGYVFQNN